MGETIQIKNLGIRFPGQRVIRDMSVDLPPGSLTALAGPNGAGKSTLLDVIAGLRRPDKGQVGGFNPHSLAYLPQRTRLDRSFPFSVQELVATGLWHGLGPWRRVSPHQCVLVRQALEAVGLTGLERRVIGSLSGGQLQRALFARLLVQEPGVILLDEPFAGVDASTSDDLMVLIKNWHRQGRTLLVVSHDLEQVRRHFPHTLLLVDGGADYGPTGEILAPSNPFLLRGAA